MIVGHTVQAGGALNHLGKLSIGDPIELTTTTGQQRYRVGQLLAMDKTALARAADQIFAEPHQADSS